MMVSMVETIPMIPMITSLLMMIFHDSYDSHDSHDSHDYLTSDGVSLASTRPAGALRQDQGERRKDRRSSESANSALDGAFGQQVSLRFDLLDKEFAGRCTKAWAKPKLSGGKRPLRPPNLAQLAQPGSVLPEFVAHDH